MSKSEQQQLDGEVAQTPSIESGENSLQREDIFEVLSNRRRRYVLHYLKQFNDKSETVSLSEVASHVAAWENDVDVAEVSYDGRKSVQTSLYQLHLPKLAGKNLIEYDRRAGEIKQTDAIEEIEIYLEAIPENEISWPVFFLGVSTASFLLAIGVAIDAVLIGILPATVWFLIASLGYLGASLWFTYHHRYKMRLGSDGLPPECNSK
jgi:DNA-binding transcriptional ArsR family regulator